MAKEFFWASSCRALRWGGETSCCSNLAERLNGVRHLVGRDLAESRQGAGSTVGVGLLALVILTLGIWSCTQADDDDGATPGATAKATKHESPPDASSDVVVQIADEAYTRPTAKDQQATGMIPAAAWGKPVDGLRLAIVLRSSPIDKDECLCYDIVVENLSDHDIRFSAEVGIDTWHFYFTSKLVDADGKEVAQHRAQDTLLGPRLTRIWLKPKERLVIFSWASRLFKLDEEGKRLAKPEEYRGPAWFSSFSVKPGRYSLSAAVELGPGWNSVDPISKKRTVLSPAKGEWSGKLQTGAVPVVLFTHPARWDEAAAKDPPPELRTAASVPDAAALQGNWRAMAAIGNGKPVPNELLPNIKVVFAGEKMTFTPPEGGDRRVLEFTFKVDPSKKPKAMTLTRLVDGLAQKSGPGIYSLAGDTLKLCLAIRKGKAAPTEFAAPEDSGLIMLTLEKSKE